MKISLLVCLGVLSLSSRANLIVDREIDHAALAEAMPATVKYTFYNTFGQ